MEKFLDLLWEVIMFFPPPPLLYEDDYLPIRVLGLIVGAAVALIAKNRIKAFDKIALSCTSICTLVAAVVATVGYLVIRKRCS